MEKLLLRFTSSLLIVLSLAACGPGNSTDAPVGLDAYTPVNDLFGEKTSTVLAGSGVVRFNSPMIGQDQSFKLKGSLDTLSGSYIGVVFYSNSLNITNNSGVEVRFTRFNATVQGNITVRSASSTIDSARFAFYYPANLDVVIQVKNSPSGARILIWRRDLVTYSIANVDVDSSLIAHVSPSLPAYGGQGNFIGLTMNFATVTAAQIGALIVAL
ncbi:hypothetical protein D3C87_123700 [compost metagenome]